MTTPATPPKTKQPGPPLWLSIGVVLVAAALVSFGGFNIFNRALEAQTVDSFEVPGSEQRLLEPGDYDVYGLAGGFTDFDADPIFARGDVTVTWVETNTEIPVDQQTLIVEVGRELNRYESVGIFTVEELGTYRVDIASPDDSRAVVARSIFASFDEVRIPLVLLGVGLIFVVIGVLMIIIGILRRSKAKRAERMAGSTPGIYQTPPPTAPPPTNPAAPLSPTPPVGAAPPPAPSPTSSSSQSSSQAPPAPPAPPSDSGEPTTGETNTPW